MKWTKRETDLLVKTFHKHTRKEWAFRWQEVADHINKYHHNNRTAQACRRKYERYDEACWQDWYWEQLTGNKNEKND